MQIHLQEILKRILYKFNLIADYVIEYGTDGIWAYEKCASGKAACSGVVSVSVTAWTAWGYSYEGNPVGQQAFPIGLFTNDKITFHVTGSYPGGLLGVETMYTVTATKTPVMYPLRPTGGGTGTIYLGMEAIGRWK